MNSRPIIACLAIVVAWATVGYAQDELKKQATWAHPSVEQLRSRMTEWMHTKQLEPITTAKVEMILSDANMDLAGDSLQSVCQALALIEPRVDPLLQSVHGQRRANQVQRPSLAVLDEESLDPFVRNNVSLLAARWMVQNRFYDEAFGLLSLLKTDNVVDPASLLFYRALVEHRLFAKDACLKSLDRLFENESKLPRRFVQVGRIMKMDIRAMKAESLDHAARMMDDINRRISLYRSGTKVIGQEEKVIDMLDKIIENLEKQQQQQQSASTNPSNPMQDSRIAGGKGDGRAQSKNYGDGGDWGNLPPSKRAKAMAEMTKDLPPHYREVIEEYFRQIAKDDDK